MRFTKNSPPRSPKKVRYHSGGERTRAVAVNWDAREESGIDEQISQMIKDVLHTGEDLDEIAAYRRIFPATAGYNPKQM